MSEREGAYPDSGEKRPETKAEEARREEALSFLIETRRAQNREDAERYLEQMNRIKEKLLMFLKDYTDQYQTLGMYLEIDSKSPLDKGLTVADMQKTSFESIDRT